MSKLVRVALVFVALAAPAHAALVSSVFNGRVPCAPGGVGQICSSAGIVNRAESWDG